MKNVLFYFSILLTKELFSDQSSLPWVTNGYHGLELDYVQPFLPENSVILEAGGHYGEDTVILANRWSSATIYTFEPCPAYYKKLLFAVKNLPQIHSFPYGLYSKTGVYSFYVSKKWDGASSLLKDNNFPTVIYE